MQQSEQNNFQFETVKWMLKHINISEQFESICDSPLHWVCGCQRPNLDTIDYLMERGSNELLRNQRLSDESAFLTLTQARIYSPEHEKAILYFIDRKNKEMLEFSDLFNNIPKSMENSTFHEFLLGWIKIEYLLIISNENNKTTNLKFYNLLLKSRATDFKQRFDSFLRVKTKTKTKNKTRELFVCFPLVTKMNLLHIFTFFLQPNYDDHLFDCFHDLIKLDSCPINSKMQYGITVLHLLCIQPKPKPKSKNKMIKKIGKEKDKKIKTETKTEIKIETEPKTITKTKTKKTTKKEQEQESQNEFQNTIWVKIMDYLLDNNLSINAKDEFSQTPLHWMCKSKKANYSMMEYLIQNGADLHAANQQKQTPFHQSCLYNNSKKIFRLLMKSGSKIHGLSESLQTPFLDFCKRYNPPVKILKLLIQNGANVNATNGYKYNGLHYLCQKADPPIEIVKMLIQNGCNVKQQTTRHSTPLDFLCIQPNASLDVIKLLLQNGAVPSFQMFRFPNDNEIKIQNPPLVFIKLFFDTGFKSLFLQQNVRTHSLLHIVCRRNTHQPKLPLVKYLIEKGLNVNTVDINTNETPLHFVCKTTSPSIDAIDCLIKMGASVNALDIGNNTPLHLACMNEHASFQAIKLLIDAGANINASNEKGRTPLFYQSPINKEDKFYQELSWDASDWDLSLRKEYYGIDLFK
ncbi:ankyrin repeat-containing protein [Anaeramoeba flamelloides]|uniref:Ankyrin repeat-containing protein n=1 Tax=Anaeramoeba flamelloides TaxID=1746091 RepID=A0AAV7Y4W9_9EUKA|nr:ankyrin repeat-containing protein [Anaeramoeba flamelloides]